MSLLTTLTLILLPPLLTTLIWLTALYQHPPTTTSTTASSSTNPRISNTRILILISHPDDEAMFFSPTLLHLTSPPLKNDIRLICLSSGNADGIGSIRKKEIVASCEILGIPRAQPFTPPPSQSKVLVIDHPSLPDSMTVTWPAEIISNEITSEMSSSWGDESWQPEVIITFDNSGVSGHENHISAWRGAREYILQNPTKKIKLLTLTTTSIFRKYLSIWDYPFTYLSSREEKSYIFVSSLNGFAKARSAMTDAHVSQMRWFRWGWIWASRYMVVNDLVEEDVIGGRKAGVGEGEKKEL